MRKVLCGFVLLGLLSVAPLANAAEMKFGYFDLQRIMYDSQRGKKEWDVLAKRGAELEKVFVRKRDELKALGAELSKKDSLLNEQVRRNKEKDYQLKAKDLERLQSDAKTELGQMRQDIMNRLGRLLNKVITKMGDEEKYTLLLDIGMIAYAPKELDITDKVIKAFDAAKE